MLLCHESFYFRSPCLFSRKCSTICSKLLQISECETNKLSQPSHFLSCSDGDQHWEDDSQLEAGGTHGTVCLANMTRKVPAWLPSLGQNMWVFVCVAAWLEHQICSNGGNTEVKHELSDRQENKMDSCFQKIPPPGIQWIYSSGFCM